MLPELSGLSAHKSESVESPLGKRVAKNKELARALGEQWAGIAALRFPFSVVYLFSSAGGKNNLVSSKVEQGDIKAHVSLLLSSWVNTVQGSI